MARRDRRRGLQRERRHHADGSSPTPRSTRSCWPSVPTTRMNSDSVGDDTVPAFAQRGTSTRHVDVIAPGVHVLGLRAPGGSADLANPGARVGSRFFRGSGTSQAAAVVSGLAALYLQKYPAATPDQVKKALMTNATPPSYVKRVFAGLGVPDVNKAIGAPLPAVRGPGRPPAPRAPAPSRAPAARRTSPTATPRSPARSTSSAGRGTAPAGRRPPRPGRPGSAAAGAASTGRRRPGRRAAAGTATPGASADWSSHAWSSHAWSSHAWSDFGLGLPRVERQRLGEQRVELLGLVDRRVG